jgi:YegS/Rv2252/BmrU family lipid kinase
VDLAAALTILREHGWAVDVRQKLHGGDATELAREAARDGCNVVVNCGGDGTLSEIVEGLAGTGVAVGTLPGGTTNLWAHEVGISPQLGMAAMQLVDADRRRVDVGQVEVNGRHRQTFILVAGLGLDGAIVARVDKPLKNHIGKAAVGLAAARALPGLRPVPVRMELDGLHWQGQLTQIVVGNSRRYAGFTRITPDAYMDDGLLDVCLISASGPLQLARQFGSLLLRGHPSAATAQTYRAGSVTIYAPVVLPLQLDGGSVRLDGEEPTAQGVVYRLSVRAQSATLLVPRLYDGTLFAPQRQAVALADMTLHPIAPVGAARNGYTPQQTDGHANGSGNDEGHGKRKRWRVRVLEVGVDALTVARLKDGRVVRVVIGTDATLKHGHGKHGHGGVRPLQESLSALAAGDRIKVTGRKHGKGALLAERVTPLGPEV